MAAHPRAHFLALSSRALNTSRISGSSPADSSGVFFSSQSEERIWCLRVPIRESRPSAGFDAWQSSSTKSSGASNPSSTTVLSFSFSWSDDLLSGDDVELTIAALSESAPSSFADAPLSRLLSLTELDSAPLFCSVHSSKASLTRSRPGKNHKDRSWQ